MNLAKHLKAHRAAYDKRVRRLKQALGEERPYQATQTERVGLIALGGMCAAAALHSAL